MSGGGGGATNVDGVTRGILALAPASVFTPRSLRPDDGVRSLQVPRVSFNVNASWSPVGRPGVGGAVVREGAADVLIDAAAGAQLRMVRTTCLSVIPSSPSTPSGGLSGKSPSTPRSAKRSDDVSRLRARESCGNAGTAWRVSKKGRSSCFI